jgi:hypothetical protein
VIFLSGAAAQFATALTFIVHTQLSVVKPDGFELFSAFGAKITFYCGKNLLGSDMATREMFYHQTFS